MTSTPIPFQGINNFRDLAFAQAGHSNGIRAGKIYRADNPSKMTALDCEQALALNIDVVFDLRDPGEMVLDQNRGSIAAERIEASLLEPGHASPAKLGEGIKAMTRGDVSQQSFMAPIYDLIDARKIGIWRQVFERLNQGQTILFHCTAGRDRTGITAALIQLAMGLDTRSIIQDHVASNDYLQPFYTGYLDKAEAEHGPEARAKLADVLMIKPWMMETFLARVNTDYGSAENLLDLLGADLPKIKRLYLA